VTDVMMQKVKRSAMRTRACHVLTVFAAVLLVADNSSAWACAVCFGAVDSPMTQGMSMAILFMLGILACVATGFVMFFVRLFKLSRTSVGRDILAPRSVRSEGSY
tara:strand:- start:529 stop:843 length:315 start_codon:yes stop_codon:yes gene_type:complete